MAESKVHLVIGLGNPGQEYAETRHNVGFRVLDALANQHDVEFRVKRRLTLAIAEVKEKGGRMVLGKPLTFMNQSGEAVAGILRQEKFDLTQLLIVADDADLELGRLRLRAGGASGGHRGLASIITVLGDDRFARLRVGIGRQGRPGQDLTEHVLGEFEIGERQKVDESVTQAMAAVECWQHEGLEKAMNQFNVKWPK